MAAPDPKLLKRLFERPAGSNKYDFGHVLVLGGAPGMVGAPFLSARAALRTGAGLATIASMPAVIDKLERQVEELMTLRLPASNVEAASKLDTFIGERKVKAVLIGPGLPATRAGLVRQLLQSSKPAAVLDAGGLGAYNDGLEGLRQISDQHAGIILTPHAGEFSRLINRPLPADKAALNQLVIETAKIAGATIILKGDHSFVASPAGETYRNTTGNPGLATAGTGDVLTGVLGGLLARGFTAFEAAVAGIYLHGLAGDLAAAAQTEPGLIASDVIDSLPAALRRVRSKLKE